MLVDDVDLFFINELSCKDRNELLSHLSTILEDNGNVKESFYQALIDREANFPTGLEAKEVNIAIPHADAVHVNKPAIVIAKLKDTIDFNCMIDLNKDIPVKLVFLLAITKPELQVNLLQQLMGLIESEDKINTILNASESEDVINLLS